MYFLIKHDLSKNISQVVYYHNSCNLVRNFLQTHLEKFIKDNSNLEKEYSYIYNDNSTSVLVKEKSMTIRRGYIWNSVEYQINDHSYYSISYYSNHYITNVSVETYKVFHHNDKVVGYFNNVIKELKKNSRFLKYNRI